VAEVLTIEGQRYVKRDPLGVLGLSFITIGIHWFSWYSMVNDEIRRYEKDDSVRPGIAIGLYSQEHLNKVWGSAANLGLPPASPGTMPPPPA
jgi:hypothetical protein